MDKLVIEGGHTLHGEVSVSGSKNAALPILIATILAPGIHEINNVPMLTDIETTVRLIERLGGNVERNGDSVRVDTTGVDVHEATYDLVKTMRASVLVLSPLLKRFGTAKVSLPGGCAIGTRPIDLHLKGLSSLGAKIEIAHGYVEVSATRLKGAQIYFKSPTVGGTEQLMMAAVFADGLTVLENAAREPEVVALSSALNAMGASISGAGTDTISIEGVSALTPGRYTVIPDRIEAGTLMVAGAITGGYVSIRNADIRHLTAIVDEMRRAGVEVHQNNGSIEVSAPERLTSLDIITNPYPGFPTDMQAQIMALMSLAKGTSLICETIFENRFMHVPELCRLGAGISVSGNKALVKGADRLSGAPLMASDLRASASLVLAALAADGVSEVHRIYHLDRGYEGLELKLAALGANIERVKV